MIKAIELENYKAFGRRTRIEFAPITLIYGENSAGKSSILNSLNLLKQTRVSRDQTALLLPRAERGLVDLGSFHELLHDHDSSKTLSIRLDLDLDDFVFSLGFEAGFKLEDKDGDVLLAFLRLYALGLGLSEPIFEYSPVSLDEKEQRDLWRYSYFPYRRTNRKSVGEIKAVACTSISRSPLLWEPLYREAKDHSSEVVRALGLLHTDVAAGSTQKLRANPESGPTLEQLDAALAFYRSDFSYEDFVDRRVRAESRTRVAVDGFIPLPGRVEPAFEFPESIALRLARERQRRWRTFELGELIVEAGRTVENELGTLFPLGPYRRAPKRLYIFTGTTPADVGYSGDLLPDLLYRKRGLVKETNEWLDRLDIGYHLDITSVGTRSNDLFEVRLLDQRRAASTSIALPDVGFGISQILPFIVQTLASVEQTITIEQPEVHIHPRLQADLADLLVAGIQPGRKHRFIVETHSEHLILRLLRRVRETSERDSSGSKFRLTPQQVSVVYLERGKDGTHAHHLRIDEQGEFTDRWPRGFFEERAKELF